MPKNINKTSGAHGSATVCCSCLGTGKYQTEHNCPAHWHLIQFSPTHWSIIGRLKTLNDGESREEVMGVAEYREAVRIRDNHNGEMDELYRIMLGCEKIIVGRGRLLTDLKNSRKQPSADEMAKLRRRIEELEQRLAEPDISTCDTCGAPMPQVYEDDHGGTYCANCAGAKLAGRLGTEVEGHDVEKPPNERAEAQPPANPKT